MKFESLLNLVGDDPVFEASLLLAGDVDPASVRLQLTRWTQAGKIVQLRRSLYALAPPYQKIKPHPYLVANRLSGASYVSCQSALAFYDLIPEVVPATVSITSGRPQRWDTLLGVFEFHHVKPALLRGYQMTDLGNGQQAFIATPEKALLDLVYLQPGSDSTAFLGELRLQNLEKLNLEKLRRQSEAFYSSKLHRALELIIAIAQEERQEFEII